MDGIDHALIAKAESLAGPEVHRIANLIQVYVNGMNEQGPGHSRALRLAMEAEQKLRLFVCAKELARCN